MKLRQLMQYSLLNSQSSTEDTSDKTEKYQSPQKNGIGKLIEAQIQTTDF